MFSDRKRSFIHKNVNKEGGLGQWGGALIPQYILCIMPSRQAYNYIRWELSKQIPLLQNNSIISWYKMAKHHSVIPKDVKEDGISDLLKKLRNIIFFLSKQYKQRQKQAFTTRIKQK